MPNTFIKIQTVTVGAGGAANIEFTSIPQTYTDLKLVFSLRSNRVATADIVYFRFNTSTTNYSSREVFGNGSGVGSNPDTNMSLSYSTGANTVANIFSNGESYILDYTNTSFFKRAPVFVGADDNATQGYVTMTGNLWSDTSAINRIVIVPVLGTLFTQYSSATLYGIKSS